jgi:aminoglycoside 3-N-acetyltransferase
MPHIDQGAPIFVDGEEVWQTYEDVDVDSDDFAALGETFEAEREVKLGKVGSAKSRLFRQPTAVDFAEHWLQSHRKRPTLPD